MCSLVLLQWLGRYIYENEWPVDELTRWWSRHPMWPRSILASRLRWLLATAGRARSLLLVAFGLSFIPHQPRPTILLPSTYRLYGRRLLEEMTSLEVVQQWWEFWVNNLGGRVYYYSYAAELSSQAQTLWIITTTAFSRRSFTHVLQVVNKQTKVRRIM